MADFIGQDLAGSRFEDVHLTSARFRHVDLTGAAGRAGLSGGPGVSGPASLAESAADPDTPSGLVTKCS